MRFQLTLAALLMTALAVLFAPSPLGALAADLRHLVVSTTHRHADHAQHHHGLVMQALPAAAPVARTNGETTPLLGNLGSHHVPITTASELAQRYFDEGLILTYGFNHAEAIRSFQDAITLDPSCAMCHWGVALALGPNINLPMDPALIPAAQAAVARARELAPAATPIEQALIEAQAARYASGAPSDRAALDLAYAAAMREVSHRFPDDLDAATLFAESLMDLTPWQFWTRDGRPTTYTDEIVATLESVLSRSPDHPGANHFYIHAVEASQTPERAVPSAQRLERLVPGAGHLTHMPGHIYWRVGRYHDAARVNEFSIDVDEATLRRGARGADQGSHSFYFLAYYPHNVHFLFAAAHMEGRRDLALAAARKLVAVIPEGAYGEVPSLEDFRPMPLFAMVRFGMWDAILAEPRPAASLQYTTGIWHWARGLALVRSGDLDAAAAEYRALDAIARSDAMQELTLASFPKATVLLQIAGHVLAGELASARGRVDEAVERLRAGAAMQDELAYIEPPAWFAPVRHHLGAVLLAAGRAGEAEEAYREDLRQYPHNGWSLFGLAASLRAQGKLDAAADAERAFGDAWQHADVTLSASRY